MACAATGGPPLSAPVPAHLVGGRPHHFRQRCHAVGLLKPTQWDSRFGALSRFSIGICAREDASDAMRAEQLKCSVHPISVTGKSDVDDRQIGRVLRGEFKRFFTRWRNADHLKSGLSQRNFDLCCD